MAATAHSAGVSRIEKAHQMYREGRHEEALAFYTEALVMARAKAQRIALHSNRAACYLKLHDFKRAAEECTSVLELDRQHTGALMLRAQTLVTLKEYQSALFDVNRLMEFNPSSDVYRNLQARLKTQLSLPPILESEEESLVTEEENEEREEKASVQDAGGKIAQRSSKQESPATQTQIIKSSPAAPTKGWEAIPKPKGHSGLDYSRWDKVVDDSSEEEEDEEEQPPQYRFRVRNIGVRSVK